MTPAPTVFVVDDDPAVRKALGRLLHAEGLNVETYPSAESFLETLTPATLGCLILDLAMPGLSGLELQQALTERNISLPIIFLTGRGDIPSSVRAMKRGAVDFLTKPVEGQDLIAAIRLAINRGRSSAQSRDKVTEVHTRLTSLTPRERQVLCLIVTGMLNKQVAAHLGAAEKTIKVHRARVMRKMRADSFADLVRMAQRAGIGPEAI